MSANLFGGLRAVIRHQLPNAVLLLEACEGGPTLHSSRGDHGISNRTVVEVHGTARDCAPDSLLGGDVAGLLQNHFARVLGADHLAVFAAVLIALHLSLVVSVHLLRERIRLVLVGFDACEAGVFPQN